MTVTQRKGKSTEEKQANRLRIAQDKARARRWAERRKEKTVRAIPTNTAITAVAVPCDTNEKSSVLTDLLARRAALPCDTNEKSSVLTDLLARRAALLQELSEIDTALEVIRRTCN